MADSALSIRIEGERERRLDSLAKRLQRSRTALVDEAIDAMLDTHDWQVEEIEQGLAEARRGEFVSDAEIARLYNRYEPDAAASQ